MTQSQMATSIIVLDTFTGIETWFRSKYAFLYSDLFGEYLARRRDFRIYCGCKDTSRAELYGRTRMGRRELCTSPIDGSWPHEWDCDNWPEIPGTSPRRSLTELSREAGPSALLAAPPLTNAVGGGAPAGKRGFKRHKRRQLGPNSLSSMILYLLDATGLNHYQPSPVPPTWGSAAGLIVSKLDNILASSEEGKVPHVVADGRTLRLMDIPYHDDNLHTLTAPIRVIGHVTKTRKDGNVTLVAIEGFAHEIRIPTERWEYAMRRSASRHTRRALKGLDAGEVSARVLAMFEITRDNEHDVIAHRAGLCTTSREFTPVESSYELEAAVHLASRGFHFAKDIYVPDGYRYRYDFRVFLEDGELILEVYGMCTDSYLSDKAPAEHDAQTRHRGRIVIWRAYAGGPLPRIPRLVAEMAGMMD